MLVEKIFLIRREQMQIYTLCLKLNRCILFAGELTIFRVPTMEKIFL